MRKIRSEIRLPPEFGENSQLILVSLLTHACRAGGQKMGSSGRQGGAMNVLQSAGFND